jgi:hypothetical protein
VVTLLAILLVAGAFMIGARIGDLVRVVKIARKYGWTREHMVIYRELIKVNSQLVARHEHEAFLADPMLMSVMLPTDSSDQIRELLNRYRKEKGIA